jgi:hypothetical protein
MKQMSVYSYMAFHVAYMYFCTKQQTVVFVNISEISLLNRYK